MVPGYELAVDPVISQLRYRLFSSKALLPMCLVVIVLILTAAGRADDDRHREYRIKSAFIYHFLQYADWESTPRSSAAEISVCIVGGDPFGEAIDMLRSKHVDQQAITVKYADAPEEAVECHVAYFPQGSSPLSKQEHIDLRQSGVLTIGEAQAFTRSGGMVRFYKNRNRVRFEINLQEVRSAGIEISSRVLRLANIVTTARSR